MSDPAEHDAREPEMPDVPEAPGAPEPVGTPEVTDAPGTPDGPQVPDMPQAPEGIEEPPAEEAEAFDVHQLPGGARAALEAVLMVVDEPVDAAALASALELTEHEVTETLESLEAEYAAAARGFTVRQIGGGWRMYSRSDYGPVVEKFLLDGQRARLTQAALETLAVIAYRQPISRARVSAVRGVNVDGVVRTLLTRGLIVEVGHEGDSEHSAVLYGTTDYFLQRMGMDSLDDLPPIAPYLPDAAVLDELAAQGQA